jgi:hypothetical protein
MIRAKALPVPLAALVLCGCSVLPRGGPDPDPGEPPTAPQVPAIAAADSIPPTTPADSLAATDDTTGEATGDAEAGSAATEPRAAGSAPAEDRGPVPRETPTAPEPPAELEVVAPVQVELSAEERVALAAEARKDLELAEQALRSGDAEPTSDERREKLDTIRNLIDSAKAAYTEDLRAAATLAHKARLLAEELAGT